MTNTITTRKIPVSSLPSGELLHMNIVDVKGDSIGPHVHIQANVHGAEIQGNLVIFKLLEWLKENPINGSMTIIPFANPIGANFKLGTYTYGRFNPTTGDNWNRNYHNISEWKNFDLEAFLKGKENLKWDQLKGSFKNYLETVIDEYRFSQKEKSLTLSENGAFNLLLQKEAAKADITLDLHTGASATRYLYCAEYEKDDGKKLNFPHTLVIPDEFDGAMDEAVFSPWIALKNHLSKEGREIDLDIHSYTLELGSEERINSKEADDDLKRILSYFSKKGILDSGNYQEENQYHCKLENFITYYSPTGGLIEFFKEPGEKINKGDFIARIYNLSNYLQSGLLVDQSIVDIVAKEDLIILTKTPSGSVRSGSAILSAMTSINKL